jgi:hypothetical protein
MTASAMANAIPSGTPTYIPVLLSDDDDVDADDDNEGKELWNVCVGRDALDRAEFWDAGVGVVAIRADVMAVDTMLLISAVVYTKGSAALKVRSDRLQHVVLRAASPSSDPVAQHQEFDLRQ